jgi:hypothetical protein
VPLFTENRETTRGDTVPLSVKEELEKKQPDQEKKEKPVGVPY